jgi:hypothetical protein
MTMAEEFLHFAQRRAAFEQVRRERVPQRVRRGFRRGGSARTIDRSRIPRLIERVVRLVPRRFRNSRSSWPDFARPRRVSSTISKRVARANPRSRGVPCDLFHDAHDARLQIEIVDANAAASALRKPAE